jgi:hypothetical protein
MDNPEKLAPLGSQDAGRRQTKKYNTIYKYTHELSYKRLVVKTNRKSLRARKQKGLSRIAKIS